MTALRLASTQVKSGPPKTEPGQKFVVACIPAYNEEKAIAKVVIATQQFVNQVIVCDDGSSDMTAAIAEKLGAKVIRHKRNMGKGEALRSLFLAAREADADAMVSIDGDGQHYSSEIPRVVGPILDETADVVVGSRFLGNDTVPGYRKAGNKFLNVMTAKEVTDTQSGFRAYGRRAMRGILPAEMGMGVDSEILIEALEMGLKVVEVPISVSYGEGKTSTHNPMFHTLDVIFSVVKLTSIRHPLVFYGIPGLAIVLAGVYFAVHTLQLFREQAAITNLTLTYGIVAGGLILLGLLVVFTGLILFSLVTVIRRKD